MLNPIYTDVEVRAYDLGGFGDIAGALRVASHIRRSNVNVILRPTSNRAAKKLNILQADVPITFKKTSRIYVDVAGHYNDGRNIGMKETPHIFSEDMDNTRNRKPIVPLYIKTGLISRGRQVPMLYGGFNQNPMFYRPFREWDLPKPSQRDVKSLIEKIMFQKKKGILSWLWNRQTKEMHKPLEEMLNKTDRIALCHFNPDLDEIEFFKSPYIQTLLFACEASDENFALGLFFRKGLEDKVTEEALSSGIGVFGSNGYFKGNNRLNLIFLGPQPQLTTTSLFLSSTIPNLVTGDLSLSDAIYSLIAMEGQGFYYDCPSWKKPTMNALIEILKNTSTDLANTFIIGSSPVKNNNNNIATHALKKALSIFMTHESAETYRKSMRTALLKEIVKRFGSFEIYNDGFPDGLYIKRGAPFLFQDATESVIAKLNENQDLFAEIEKTRREITTGKSTISDYLMDEEDLSEPITNDYFETPKIID